MPDSQPTFGRSSRELERDVLYLLTVDGEPIWSVDDIGRAVGSPVSGVDAVDRLRRAGLVHQTADGFVFAAHAGYRAVAMIGAAV